MQHQKMSNFIRAKQFEGQKEGYFFQHGDHGLGYYKDSKSPMGKSAHRDHGEEAVFQSHHHHHNPEQHLKEKNQEYVKKRERQWQTVDSSSDDEERNDDRTDERKSEREEHHHKKRRKEKDSSSSSSSSSSSDSDSSSDTDESKKKSSKKHRKHHKHKHHKKEKKHKKKKSHKSHKRDRKERDQEYAKHSSVDQNEYGKYGIIREEHFFQKQREFEAYMAEVKHIAGVLHLNKREMMEHFRTFMEDYNTATMPHPKYYNYEAWEMAEYQKKLAKEREQQHLDDGDHYQYSFNDEELLKQQKKREKEQQQRQELQMIHSIMKQDKSIQEDMKRQAELRTELNIAHKRGDLATVKKLERLLAPDEPSQQAQVKHPWH